MKYFPFLVAFLFVLSGCRSLVDVDLTFVGEQSALERQVLGNYSAIGRDLTLYASVRAVQPDGTLAPSLEMTSSQQAVLQAFNNRKYNRDDVDRMLEAKAVGEGNDGFLKVRTIENAVNQETSEELLRQIIEEENSDRAIIIERLVTTTPGVTESQNAEIAWIFATLNAELAPEGSLIQNRDGEWQEK